MLHPAAPPRLAHARLLPALLAVLLLLPLAVRAAERAELLPLIVDGRLTGLVWLEGDGPRAYAVKYAAWNGEGWEAPQTIAPPGPGSQLALTAARLADGSWLLAWSAFDGHDDEIVWSRLQGGAWSRPQRVAADNDVPDITPALTRAGSAALLAWSRFEAGEYRLVVSRFVRGAWTPPQPVAPPGSFFPTFAAAPADSSGRARVLYRTAAPSGWALLELDGAGRPLRRAAVSGLPGAAMKARPVVADEAGSVTFRWPAAAAGAADTVRGADWERADIGDGAERRP